MTKDRGLGGGREPEERWPGRVQEGGERPAAKGDLGPRAEAATPRATLLGAHSARTLGGTVPTLMATPFSVGHCLFVKEKNPCVRREARQMPCLTERSPERGSGLPQSMYGGHGRGRPTSSPPGSVSGPLSCHPPRDKSRKMLAESRRKEAWRSRAPAGRASRTTHASVLRVGITFLVLPHSSHPPLSPSAIPHSHPCGSQMVFALAFP